MKKENQLILTTVILNKTKDERELIKKLLSEKLDWGYIGGILINHRLSGYFYMGLESNLMVKVPKEIREALKLLVIAQKEQQLRNCGQVEFINKELLDNNIRFAALKGAFFNAEMYELGLRRSNDIDFLVYEEDLEKLDVTLRRLGYIQSNLPKGQLIEASKREKLIQRMNHHDLVPYVKRVNDEVVEVDINFLFDGKENMIDKQVFDIGTKRYGKTYSVNALVPETNLAFLCVHFFREATNTIWTDTKRDLLLYKIVDIMNFIRVYSSEKGIINIAEKTLMSNDAEVRYNSSKCSKQYYDFDAFTSVVDLGNGSIILKEQSLFLFNMFNEYFSDIVKFVFEDYEQREYPVMLSVDKYQKTGYLKNSPQYAIFCSTVRENISELENVDNSLRSQCVDRYLKYPQYALSPSACFHTYVELENMILDNPKVFTFVQRVFRNEGRFNINTFARLRDYHVREIVIVGDWNYVRTKRELLMTETINLLKKLGIEGDLTVASDPFIIPKMQKYKKIQVCEKSKYSIAELKALKIEKLECKGQLFTIRNIAVFGDTIVCLDKNMYLGKVDYEVEIEYRDEINNSIIDTFKELGVSFSKCIQGKNTRFHTEYLDNWRD